MGDDGTGLQEIDAGANACSVEWCPITGLESYMTCSTYCLKSAAAAAPGTPDDAAVKDEAVKADACMSQTRSGSVVLHKLASDPAPLTAGGWPTPAWCLKEAAKESLDGGVLDAKWCQRPLDSTGAGLLACATSTGRLVLFTLSAASSSTERGSIEEAESAKLRHFCSSDAGDSLLLSLDWSGGGIADNAKIVVSQSDGALAIWRLHPNGGAPVQETGPWYAHTLRGGVPTEAWISFFRKGDDGSCGGQEAASFVVSGADDALMKGWDLRAGGGGDCGALPAFVCKTHEAGVTTGQWHPSLQHVFVSGSYDEKVRVWDARALRDPVSTTPTGGGVWRLKWHPNPGRGNLLLAACMHAGIRVFDSGMGSSDPLVQESLSGSSEDGTLAEDGKGVVAKYTRHASMAYGADWCRLPTLLQSKRALVASCSFYDSLLCLWETPPLWS